MPKNDPFSDVADKPWWERFVFPNRHNYETVKDAAKAADKIRSEKLESLPDDLDPDSRDAAELVIYRDSMMDFNEILRVTEATMEFEILDEPGVSIEEIMVRDYGCPPPNKHGNSGSLFSGYEVGFYRGYMMGEMATKLWQTENARRANHQNTVKTTPEVQKRHAIFFREAIKIKDSDDSEYKKPSGYNAICIAEAIENRIRKENLMPDYCDEYGENIIPKASYIKKILTQTGNRSKWEPYSEINNPYLDAT